MNISYKLLLNILKLRNINKKDLLEKANLTISCIINIGKNEYISLTNIERICEVFQYDVGELVCYCKVRGNSINE